MGGGGGSHEPNSLNTADCIILFQNWLLIVLFASVSHRNKRNFLINVVSVGSAVKQAHKNLDLSLPETM